VLSFGIITAVVDSLEGGVIVLDSQGQVCFANKWFLKVSARSKEKVAQKDLVSIFPELQTAST